MKVLKRVGVFVAAMMMVLSLTACGGSSVDGTYTHNVYLSESENLWAWSALFLPAISNVDDYKNETTPVEVNSLVLEGDTYTLTKKICVETEAYGKVIDLNYTFTGTYTAEENTVTLAVPTECEYKVVWCDAAIKGSGGMIANSEGTSTDVTDECFTYFNGDYVANASEVTEQVVIINTEDGSFACK